MLRLGGLAEVPSRSISHPLRTIGDVPIEVTATAYGPATFDALAAAVRRVKHGDPLVPMSVIVPTNTAGVMARRALGRRGGATAIDVLTLFRAAEVLGSPTLLARGRKPVSTPVVDLAVKQVLARSPVSTALSTAIRRPSWRSRPLPRASASRARQR